MKPFVIFFIFAFPAFAGDISGKALVLDGDTLLINGQKVRLFGIDAPEIKQTCQKEGREYNCGEVSKQHLIKLIGGKGVICGIKSKDTHGRFVAVCFKDGLDIGSHMVLDGQAVAYRRYSAAYILAEADAKSAKRGLWAGDFQNPWEYRKDKSLENRAF